MAKRWKLIPLADQPQGPSVTHGEEVHEGDEESLAVALANRQAITGTPHRAEEWDDEEDEADAEEGRKAEKRQDRVRKKQDESDKKRKPVED